MSLEGCLWIGFIIIAFILIFGVPYMEDTINQDLEEKYQKYKLKKK